MNSAISDEERTIIFEEEGRELGKEWITEVDRTDAALSRRFVDFLAAQRLKPLLCEFTSEGLKFRGDNIVIGVMVVKMLNCALENVKSTTRFISMKNKKSKEKLLARLTGAFWLPFVTILAPLGTHKQGETYTLTWRKVKEYQQLATTNNEPQKLMAKYFRTPRRSKWSDTATILDPKLPIVSLYVGERAEGKGTQPQEEEGPKRWTVRELKAEIEVWRDRVDELDMIVEDLIEERRELMDERWAQEEELRKLRLGSASVDGGTRKRKEH